MSVTKLLLIVYAESVQILRSQHKKKCLTAPAEESRFVRAQITHPDDVAES